jgi:hypothetical protein
MSRVPGLNLEVRGDGKKLLTAKAAKERKGLLRQIFALCGFVPLW